MATEPAPNAPRSPPAAPDAVGDGEPRYGGFSRFEIELEVVPLHVSS